jgi:RimJ/RimL family protein N-acetyltransferase
VHDLAARPSSPVPQTRRSPIPLEGPIAAGRRVALGWPEEHEFDAITALRNSETARHRFFDSRLIDVERNREWLRSGMKRPYEGLLSIRLEGSFVGMAGWSDWDPQARSVEIGRIVVDTWSVMRSAHDLPDDYPGIGADAVGALVDLMFNAFEVERMYADIIVGNPAARRLATQWGGEVTTARRQRPDGSIVEVHHFELPRPRWLAHRASVGCTSDERAAG